MKKNVVKFAIAILALGGTAQAQITDRAARERANRAAAQAMRNTSSWITFESHEPQKHPTQNKPTVAPVCREPKDMPRCITFEEFISAMRDSANWIKVPDPMMDTMPVKNGKVR